MFHRPTLHRLGAWLRRSRSTGEHAGPSPSLVSWSVNDNVAPVPVAVPALDGVGATDCLTGAPPASLDPHHERGLHLAEAHRWNWAQRELEQATRAAVPEQATADLVSVREVRRQLRVLRKWPRDVPAHLALGRCYFELGLGADAEETFRRVLTLAPDEPAAPCFLALEYAFRGAWPAAEDAYARARALVPELPPFADWLGEQGSAMVGDAAES